MRLSRNTCALKYWQQTTRYPNLVKSQVKAILVLCQLGLSDLFFILSLSFTSTQTTYFCSLSLFLEHTHTYLHYLYLSHTNKNTLTPIVHSLYFPLLHFIIPFHVGISWGSGFQLFSIYCNLPRLS